MLTDRRSCGRPALGFGASATVTAGHENLLAVLEGRCTSLGAGTAVVCASSRGRASWAIICSAHVYLGRRYARPLGSNSRTNAPSHGARFLIGPSASPAPA